MTIDEEHMDKTNIMAQKLLEKGSRMLSQTETSDTSSLLQFSSLESPKQTEKNEANSLVKSMDANENHNFVADIQEETNMMAQRLLERASRFLHTGKETKIEFKSSHSGQDSYEKEHDYNTENTLDKPEEKHEDTANATRGATART